MEMLLTVLLGTSVVTSLAWMAAFGILLFRGRDRSLAAV